MRLHPLLLATLVEGQVMFQRVSTISYSALGNSSSTKPFTSPLHCAFLCANAAFTGESCNAFSYNASLCVLADLTYLEERAEWDEEWPEVGQA